MTTSKNLKEDEETILNALRRNPGLKECFLEMINITEDPTRDQKLKFGDDAEEAVVEVIQKTGKKLLEECPNTQVITITDREGDFAELFEVISESQKNSKFAHAIIRGNHDGLERLIRYCARPCFVSENLRWNGHWLVHRLPKPNHKGQTFIQLEPIEFLEKIAAFIPPPHRHRHHYHGVFAHP